jgi:LysM repeat protein
MARVIVILGLMIAITAAMFWVTRKPQVTTEAAATPAASSATVSLAELQSPKTAGPDDDLAEKTDETQSPTSAEPRLVTNTAGDAKAEGPASAQDVTSGPVEGAAPSIGTAGIDHKNNASFTGTATPGDAVSLVWDKKPVSWTTADTSGNWTLEFKAPSSKGEHELYVTAQGKDGAVVVGPQRAFIGPPAMPGGMPRITLKSADQSTKTLQEGVTAGSEPATGIIVEKITGGESGSTTVTGKADPGATVKAALNGEPAGETVVGTDGSWSITAANSTAKNAESLRLELQGADGAKLDEAELPYKTAAAPKAVESAPKTMEGATAVLTSKVATNAAKAFEKQQDVAALFQPPSQVEAEKPKRRVIRVRRGDSLWRISKRHLGNGKKWDKFYRLNKRKIDNPDLIYPGQTLILPG